MILYIDETENEQYFIVTGLLTSSRLAVDYSFKHFKNSVRKMDIKQKYKERIFVEFKSGLIDRNYKRIKYKLLEEIKDLESSVVYSCYVKKEYVLKQETKEKIYIQLVEKIVSYINDKIDVIFDEFGIDSFEREIINNIGEYKNVNSIIPMNSKLEAGLMYVDNLCSVIRLHLTNDDKYKFYDYIKDIAIEV